MRKVHREYRDKVPGQPHSHASVYTRKENAGKARDTLSYTIVDFDDGLDERCARGAGSCLGDCKNINSKFGLIVIVLRRHWRHYKLLKQHDRMAARDIV